MENSKPTSNPNPSQRNNLKDDLKNSKTVLQEDIEKVGETISQTATHAKDKADDLIHEAKDKTAQYQDSLIKYVKNNPLAAIGYSALAGFVIAMLMHNK